MRSQIYFASFVTLGVLGCLASFVDDGIKQNAVSAADPQSDQQEMFDAVERSAEQFTKAFNSADANAIAALFTPDGELVGETGEVIAGRTEIEAEFAGIFEESPGRTITTTIESVKMITADVAVEDGSTVVESPGSAPSYGRYTAIHVKQQGQWLMARVRELKSEVVPTAEEHLRELEWMVGDWVDESEDSVIVTSCRWAENRSALLRTFTIKIEGRDQMTGSTRIGWDPLAKQIKSWVFDSEGGYGEGLWTKVGEDRWIVNVSGVTRDGRKASATNIITFINQDRSTWQSINRAVGGEITPDIEEVVIVRRPPEPQ